VRRCENNPALRLVSDLVKELHYVRTDSRILASAELGRFVY
jgi:hypothetical protein